MKLNVEFKITSVSFTSVFEIKSMGGGKCYWDHFDPEKEKEEAWGEMVSEIN